MGMREEQSEAVSHKEVGVKHKGKESRFHHPLTLEKELRAIAGKKGDLPEKEKGEAIRSGKGGGKGEAHRTL